MLLQQHRKTLDFLFLPSTGLTHLNFTMTLCEGYVSFYFWSYVNLDSIKGEGYFCKEFSLGHHRLTYPSNE